MWLGWDFFRGAHTFLVCWVAESNYDDAWGCTIRNALFPLPCSFVLSFGAWLAVRDCSIQMMPRKGFNPALCCEAVLGRNQCRRGARRVNLNIRQVYDGER